LIKSFEDYSISVALKIEEIQNVKLFRSKLTNLSGL
jgi:hypothetical protein